MAALHDPSGLLWAALQTTPVRDAAKSSQSREAGSCAILSLTGYRWGYPIGCCRLPEARRSVRGTMADRTSEWLGSKVIRCMGRRWHSLNCAIVFWNQPRLTFKLHSCNRSACRNNHQRVRAAAPHLQVELELDFHHPPSPVRNASRPARAQPDRCDTADIDDCIDRRASVKKNIKRAVASSGSIRI